eukprot:scaffold6231_cov108-Cylindrotheca_fusiformis.AAC.1
MKKTKTTKQELEENEDKRRLVIYIGPPETGSTTLQTFLANYAGPEQSKDNIDAMEAFKDWSYPMFFGKVDGLVHYIKPSKKYSVKTNGSPKYITDVRDEFRRQSPSKNLVVGSEYLSYFNVKHRGNAFHMFSRWSNISKPEVVVHSRTPRTSQLISYWKQVSQQNHHKEYHNWSFRQFMCSDVSKKNLIPALDMFMNPVGLAKLLVYNYGLPTYFVDMEGIAEQELDLRHVFACSILKVNCTDGNNNWVNGIERIEASGSSDDRREGDPPSISDDQFDQMEHLFRQRDCAYSAKLNRHPLFHPVFMRPESWPNQCQKIKAMRSYRNDTSLLLEDLRSIVNCAEYVEAEDLQDTEYDEAEDLQDTEYDEAEDLQDTEYDGLEDLQDTVEAAETDFFQINEGTEEVILPNYSFWKGLSFFYVGLIACFFVKRLCKSRGRLKRLCKSRRKKRRST